MKKWFLPVMLLFAFVSLSFAQDTADDVKLFENFYYDAVIAENPYVEGLLNLDMYDGWKNMIIGARGGFAVTEKIEIQAALGYVSISPDEGDGESGLSDLQLFGRYQLVNDGAMKVAAGAEVSLPIGSEDIGMGELQFGPFAAIRYGLESGMVLTANLGLLFYETTEYEFDTDTWEMKEETKYENTFHLGAGVIYPVSDDVSVVGEFNMLSEFDYMMLRAGLDYQMGGGKLRAALGIGLDDGAPDFSIIAGYQFVLGK